MRQAGRYLPDYQALRAKHSLRDLFFTPELAVQVTKMPVDLFGMDAAILFSDITVVAVAMGLGLDFKEGPKISPEVKPGQELGCDLSKLDPIMETILLLKRELKVPLLGFCGAPFTVASYLIGSLEKTVLWMREDPVSFSQLIDQITLVSSLYLEGQQKMGVDAIQIFDSWANVLSLEEFKMYSLAPLKKLLLSVTVPSIFFMRGVGPYIEEIPCAISLDWTVCLKEARGRTKQPLQGNLDPDILFQPLEEVRKKTKALCELMRNDPGFILNLGHGVKPGTPVDAVRCFVDTAKENCHA